MVQTEHPQDQLWVAIHNDTAIVHVQGRGTFKQGPSLKEFGLRALRSDCRGAVLDMADCVGMDSTFMGVLTGLAFRFREKAGGRVTLINLSARNRGLLATLGLDRTLETYVSGDTPERFQQLLPQPELLSPLGASPPDREGASRTALEAHEDLVAGLSRQLSQVQGRADVLSGRASRKGTGATGMRPPKAPDRFLAGDKTLPGFGECVRFTTDG